IKKAIADIKLRVVCHSDSDSSHRRPGESPLRARLAVITIGKSDDVVAVCESAVCEARLTIECEIDGLIDARPGDTGSDAYIGGEAIPGAEIEIAVGQQVPAANFAIEMTDTGRGLRVRLQGCGVI